MTDLQVQILTVLTTLAFVGLVGYIGYFFGKAIEDRRWRSITGLSDPKPLSKEVIHPDIYGDDAPS